jgi:8-oxo-dGTP diphosphatase
MMGEEVKKNRITNIALGAVIDKNKILLLKRNQYPYKDYWNMPGGKIEFGEYPEDASVREAKEETGLDCVSEGLKGVASEIVYENNNKKAHFMIYVSKLKPKHTNVVESYEGELRWFEINELEKIKITPSDLLMIKEFIFKENNRFFKIKMIEKDGVYTVEEFI